jgi:hypothetical protein
MPRSRTVKGGFFRSPDIQHTPVDCRLLFISLWTQADREGRLEDLPWKIRDEAFPYDQDITEQHVDNLLDILDRRDLITRYVVDGRPLIVITKWRKHQHPHPKEAQSELPGPPANLRQSRSSYLEISGNGSVHTQVRTDRARTSDTSKPSSTSGSSVPSVPSGSAEVLHTLSPASESVDRETRVSRATRLADDWRLPQTWGQWAIRELGWTREQIVDQAERFADHWHAKAGKDASKRDWLATWRNWCRKARDFGDVRVNGATRRDEIDRNKARVLTGYDPARAHGDVLDLPPEDVHVVSTKH